MSLRPGENIEHFTIVELLGEGGMGQVYLARDIGLERLVALKIVHPAKEGSSPSEGRDGAARLLREARAAAALEHPNVVTIYEVGEVRDPGEEAGRPYIAMELVKGRSLRAYVGDESVPMDQRLRWLADVARALAAAHRAGLVHRDVKPENVMVREDGTVKVLDFGVAKRAVSPSTSSTTSTEAQVLPSLTAKGVAVGTPYYMAPEQMRREGLDGRADQFSWGVVAYELCAGKPPWGREIDALELVSKLLTEHPPPLREVRPDVPAQVAGVVARAMAKKRGDRFPTMDDLLAALAADPVVQSSAPRVSLRPAGDAEGAGPSPHAETMRAIAGVSPEPRRWNVRGLVAVAAAVVAAGVASALVARKGPPLAVAIVDASPSAALAVRECARATQCIAKLQGKPAVCNPQGSCALVETNECKAHYEAEDLQRDDTVWVGAMFPLTGPAAEWGVSNMHAVELGRRDFAQAFRSLRSVDGTPRVHPLALVSCDDSSSSEAVADHLTHDLGLPAVIGFGHPQSTVSLVSSVFVPRDTLTLASITLDPMLTQVPHSPGQPRMVWRTTYRSTETADAIAQLIEAIDAKARPPAAAKTRVAVVRPNTTSAAAFAERLFAQLRFNGRPALENGSDYREFSVGDFKEPGNVAPEVAKFAPTFVVFTNSQLLAPIERALPPGSAKPVYVTDANFSDSLLRFIGKSADRRRRVFGFTTVSTTLANARFVQHYNETFSDQITRAWAPNSSYDAFYVVAYAAYSVGGHPVSGRALAEGIGKLVPPGPAFDVGATAILSAFETLSRGGAIDLNGTTGSLDFDPKTGEAPVNFAVLCADVDRDGNPIGSRESGATFDATTSRMVGEPRCE